MTDRQDMEKNMERTQGGKGETKGYTPTQTQHKHTKRHMKGKDTRGTQ